MSFKTNCAHFLSTLKIISYSDLKKIVSTVDKNRFQLWEPEVENPKSPFV